MDTSVELVKEMGLGGFAKLVNGVLRRYSRSTTDPLEALIAPLPLVSQLGCRYSFPDELIASWLERLGQEECIALCQWFNQPPRLDLRLNPLRTTTNQLIADFEAAGYSLKPIPDLPQGLVLPHCGQAMPALPGYVEGHWSVQDRAAQWVSHLLAPQPGEVVIDACAAPGQNHAYC